MNDYNLKIVNYENNTLTTLLHAYNIKEDLTFGDLSDINFNVSYHQYNGYGDLVYDSNGDKIEAYSNQFLKNENIIDINNRKYIIKDVKLQRNSNNEKIYDVYGIEKAVELSYKSIPVLDLSPLAVNPLRVDATIANLLSAKFSINDDTVVSQSTNEIVIGSSASATNDEYNEMFITIIGGSGQGQVFRITDYVGSSKTVTIDSTPTRTIDGTSTYSIYNFTWIVGDIDDVFLQKDAVDIKRYYNFTNTNIMEALNIIAERMDGYLTYTYEFDETYNEFVNKVNLVKPTAFKGNEIRYKKNLISSSRESETESQIYTKMFLYGKDDISITGEPTESRTDSGVTYDTHTTGRTYIENYQYYLSLGYDIDFCRKNFLNDKYIMDDLYVDETDLYDYGIDLLERESLPKIIYDISYVDLARVSGLSYDEFNIGDTIRVYDEEIGLDLYSTVVEKPISWDKVEGSRIVLQNYIDDLGTYFNKIINRINNI